MCRTLLLLLVTICAVHFLDCLRSQADTVSAFGGKGEISAFKLMQKNRKYQDAFTQLGKEWSVPGDLFSVLQEFTCKLYAIRCPSATVNELRYQLFRAKKGEVEVRTASSLWRLSLHAQSWCKLPGWSVAPCSGRVPQYPQPKWSWVVLWRWKTYSLLDERITCPRSCKCTSVCKLPNCQCLANGLKCTVTCKLQDCNNWQENNFTVQPCDSEDTSDGED